MSVVMPITAGSTPITRFHSRTITTPRTWASAPCASSTKTASTPAPALAPTATATALFLVVGLTLLMEVAGLTASLGAFLAGMLLADSEYRHELEADIEPFKGLLLGLFFIAVGMSANLGLLTTKPVVLLGIVGCMMLSKFTVLYAIGKFSRTDKSSAREAREELQTLFESDREDTKAS